MSLIDIHKELIKKNPKSKFKKLRNWQKEFCKYYAEKDLENHDFIGIKIPTGKGKTIIGLLLAKKYLEEEKSCVYITHTKKLIEQIRIEAQELGVETIYLPPKGEIGSDEIKRRKLLLDQQKYARGKALRVATYDSELLSGYEPAQVLIIDDADMYSDTLFKKCTIKIRKVYYPDLYNELLNELDSKKYERLEKIIEEKMPDNKYEFLMVNDSITIQEKFIDWMKDKKAFVQKKIDHGDDLYFQIFWDENSHLISYFPCYLTFINCNEIIFTLAFPSSKDVDKLYNSKIILMSATLGTPSSIKREYGLNKDIEIISMEHLGLEEEVPGYRIIFPSESHLNDTFEYAKECKKFCLKFPKAILLLYSNKERDYLVKSLPSELTMIYGKSEDTIEKFQQKEKGYLLITGRYIGIDISSDINEKYPCNVAIITQVPEILDQRDYLMSNLNGQKDFLFNKIARRLIQSFGRLNRTDQSIGVYIVLDPELNEYYRLLKNYTFYFPKSVFRAIDEGFNRSAGIFSDIIINSKKFIINPEKNIGSDPPLSSEEKILEIEKREDIFSIGFENEYEVWNYILNNNYKMALTHITEAIKKIIDYLEEFEDIRLYLTWLYYLKSSILELYINEIKDPSLWDDLKHNNSEMLKISKNSFYNKYCHQHRKNPLLPKSEPKIEYEEGNYFENIIKNPINLFGNGWESEYFKDEKDDILNGICDLGKGKYTDGLKKIIPIYEKIYRKLYNKNGGKSAHPTLSDITNFFQRKEKICKKTYSLFKNIPNSFEEIRNEIAHALSDPESHVEGVNMFNNVSLGLKYVLNDLFFGTLLFPEINLKSIQTKATQTWIQLIPESSLEKKIYNNWIQGGRIFDPVPTIRNSLNEYKGKLILEQRGGKNQEVFKLKLSIN